MKITNIIKIATLFCAVGLLLNCSSNQEYGYNEKTTSIFLSQMEKIDEADSIFRDTAKVYAPSISDSTTLRNTATNLVNNSEMDLQNLADLKPSEDATAFHQGVVKYLQTINDYGKTAEKLVATKEIEVRKKLQQELASKYQAINEQPDQVLSIQKAYLNKVGLQPK